MSRFSDRPLFRLALIGALAVALGVAACGRKGPLDPPPSASLAGEQSAAPNPMSNPIVAPIGGHSNNSNSGVDSNGHALAATGPKKHIPLDDLLN